MVGSASRCWTEKDSLQTSRDDPGIREGAVELWTAVVNDSGKSLVDTVG